MVSLEYLFDIVFHIKWPIYIAMYIFLAGMSAGIFVISTLGNVFGIRRFGPLSRIGVAVALVVLVLAMVFLIIDLGQPTKAYFTLSYLNPTSVMSWGVCLLTLYPVVGAIYAWFIFRADFARLMKRNARNIVLRTLYSILTLGQKDLSARSMERDARYARYVGMVGVPLALMVSSYTGFILAVVDAGAMWNTVLMPLLFLTSGIVSGSALLILAHAGYTRYFSRARRTDGATLRALALLMAWALVVDLLLFLCETIVLANSGAAGRDAIWLLTQGPLSGMFLGVELLLGALVPIVIVFLPATGRRVGGQLLASVLTIMGILAMRFNIVVGGQFLPIAGGEVLSYQISEEELLLSILVAVLGAVLVYVVFRILPLQPLTKGGAVPVKAAPKPATVAGGGQPALPVGGGMNRRAFVRAAMAVGGLLAASQLGVIGLRQSGSPFGTAVGASAGGGRHAMVIDLSRCIGCHSCTQACKETYDLPAGVWRSWVTKIRKSDGVNEKDMFLPRLCNQCEHPPCVKVCPVQATYKDGNGVVVQRYDRCIGCKYCMMACPYGMRFIHPELKVVDKCSFCDHLVRKGLSPACVAACPAGARIFGDLDDNTSEVSRLVTTRPTTVLKPELGTEPMVFYINGDTDLMETRVHHE